MPLVFGEHAVRIEPRPKRSAQKDREKPKPQPLLQSGSKELDPPWGFVGRGAELTELRNKLLAQDGAPVALIQGLAGLGKTALAAEAIHLWFDRFDYVFCFQAKGGALSIEEMYRRLDQRLTFESTPYRERCGANDMARVYLDPGPMLKGTVRDEKLRNNLIDALGAERILLVVDKLAALKERALWMPLGPLPYGEARLFFEGQAPIRELLYGDEEARLLARKILDVSRGHPLILARIADLARVHYEEGQGLTLEGRRALRQALTRIQGEGFEALPDVFTGAKSDKERETERKYLDDVAVGAVDLPSPTASSPASTCASRSTTSPAASATTPLAARPSPFRGLRSCSPIPPSHRSGSSSRSAA